MFLTLTTQIFYVCLTSLCTKFFPKIFKTLAPTLPRTPKSKKGTIQ